MADSDERDDDTPSNVDRLLSRFGPVPAAEPNRRPPGPTPSEDGLSRPPEQALPTPAPLFEEPHDEVFGSPVAVAVAAPPETVFESTIYDNEPVEPPLEVIDRRDWVRMPRRTGPVFRFVVVALAVGFVVTTVFNRVTSWYDDQLDPPGPPTGSVEFAIPAGATANDVTQRLYSEGAIANPTLFRYWLGSNFDGEFQAGEYSCVQEGMSFDEAILCLDGEGPLPPEFFTVTVPEGLRLTETLVQLARENPSYEIADLERDLRSPLLDIALTGVPERPLAESPDPTGSGREGLLFPATYQINERNSSNELDILAQMAQTMESKFNAAKAELGEDEVITELGLTEYEVLIVASLIEEEAITQTDRPLISRVIYNRLLRDEALGIDASTCYALAKLCSDLTGEDLDSPSPWNTRNPANRGLPPTPIASPGEAAIRAALSPEPGEWFFYVRTEEDGGHTFTTNLSDHNAAVQICRERGYC